MKHETKQEDLKCPICGSARVLSRNIQREYSVPLGPSILCETIENTCEDCQATGDFGDTNEERIALAQRESTCQSISLILDKLVSDGLSMVYIERATGLPSRTLARWKSGQCSASGAALLRMIHTYPWLLDVADRGYEPAYAQGTVVWAAGEVLKMSVASHPAALVFSLSTSVPETNPVAVATVFSPGADGNVLSHAPQVIIGNSGHS